jgi:hypothetical protein
MFGLTKCQLAFAHRLAAPQALSRDGGARLVPTVRAGWNPLSLILFNLHGA